MPKELSIDGECHQYIFEKNIDALLIYNKSTNELVESINDFFSKKGINVKNICFNGDQGNQQFELSGKEIFDDFFNTNKRKKIESYENKGTNNLYADIDYYGNWTDNTFEGTYKKERINTGPGVDVARGGSGVDTYILNKSISSDSLTIEDRGINNLELNVDKSKVELNRVGTDLIIQLLHANDIYANKGIVKNYFTKASNDRYLPSDSIITTIRFSDGKPVSLSKLWNDRISTGESVDESNPPTNEEEHIIIKPVEPENSGGGEGYERTIGKSVLYGFISEKSGGAGPVVGLEVNESLMFKLDDIAREMKVKCQLIENEDKALDKITFEYKGARYEVYPRSGEMTRNGLIYDKGEIPFSLDNGQVVISQEAVKEIFNMGIIRTNNENYFVDVEADTTKYSNLFEQSLSSLSDDDLLDILSGNSNEGNSTPVTKEIGVGNTVIISRKLNVYDELNEYRYNYKNKSGDIIGNAIGYRVQDLVDSFDNYISNYNRDGHQYTFIFNGKEIKIDCSNGGNVIIDGEIREYKQTPGLKKDKGIISYEMLQDIFNLKPPYNKMKAVNSTFYFIDSDRSEAGIAHLFGNEFKFDATSGKFIITKKYNNEDEEYNPIDKIDEAMESIRNNAGDEEYKVINKKIKYIGNNYDEYLVGNKKKNKIYGSTGEDYIEGGSGNDRLFGQAGNDVLDGQSDNDKMYGGTGNDLFLGDKGKDLYVGGKGNDIYLVHETEQLSIRDYVSGEKGKDTVFFIDGNMDSMTFDIVDKNLKIYHKVSEEDDYVILENFFKGTAYRPEQYAFDRNKEVLSESDFLKKVIKEKGSVISDGVQEINLEKGFGIYELETFSSDDYFVFHKESTVTLDNIMRDECKFIKHANKRDLIILIEESGDNIIVKEHFSANGTQLDTLVFKDLTLKTNSINENVIQGAYGLSNDGGYHSTGATVNEVDIVYGMLGNDYIWTYGGKDKIYGGKGKDYLRGGKSDDQLYGGIGDDRLYGDEGNDKLYGNEGDDKLNGGSGHDVISGGAGNDILYGGIGDDELDGGEGVNTYHFVKGFGNDVIKGNNINDCIVFDDIKSDEVLVERRMNDLLIKTTFDSSSIQVNDYFVNPGVKGIEFFNDVFWNHDEIEYRLANDETPPANIKSLKKGFGSILLDTVDSQDEVVFINFEDIAIDEVKVKRSYIYHEGDSRFGLKLEVLSTHDFIGIFNYFDEENKQEFSSNKNIGGIKFSTGEFYSKDALNNELTKICQTATEENPILSYSGKLIMNHSYYGGDNLNAKLIGGEGDDYLNLDNSEGVALGHGGDDTLYSGSKISTLYGGDGNDELYGGDNTSILDGGTGNDDLVSGSGNEIMIGGSGNDTFKFAYDFGNDVIRFSDTYVDTDKDEVIIHGIPYEDLSFSYDETLDTLEIICEKQDSKLSIEGFLSPNNKIKNYRFTIGWGTEIKSLSHQEMKNNVITEEIYGDEHDNVISTVDMVSRNRIYGLDGNDKITSGINDDTLIGGNGNDILTGNGGNDILNGGAGDDSLDGGYGIDIYEFGRGYGRDTIKTYRFTSFWGNPKNNGGEIVKFIDVKSNEVAFAVDQSKPGDLVVKIEGTNDELVIESYHNFPDEVYVDKFIFSDGVEWDRDEIEKRSKNVAIEGTDGNDEIYGSNNDDVINGYAGEDKIAAGKGDDIVYGGDDRDIIYAGLGNDRVYGGAGNDSILGYSKDFDEVDHLYGGDGNDVICGGRGIDYLYGDDGDDELITGGNDDFLYGGSGDDKLIVSGGNNILDGGVGNNQYEFDRYIDSNIIKTDSEGQFDFIHFKDTKSNEVILSMSVSDIKISLMYNEGTITVENYNWTKTLQQISFLDGVIWKADDFSEVINKQRSFTGQVIVGNDEDQTLLGSVENDILYAGKGDEVLTGNQGRDAYRFAWYFGNDIIRDNGLADEENDIEFMDKELNQVIFCKSGEDNNTLKMRVGRDDSISIENYFTDNLNKIGTIKFASGQVLDKNVLERELALMNQTTSDNNVSVGGTNLLQMDLELYGGTITESSRLYGGVGNDYLDLKKSSGEAYGGEGNDKIFAGEGNSKLYGGAGDDQLTTGEKENYLYGGDGDDRFYIKKGVNFLDGGIGSNGYYFDRTFDDTVINNSAANQDELYYVSDYIVFEETKSKEVIIKKDNEDLIITSLYSDAKITIENYYQTKAIKEIYFADQVAWNNKEIEETVEHYNKYDGEIIIGNNEDGTLLGSNNKDIIMSGQGDEILAGANGVDLYKFSGDFGHDVIRDGGLNGEFNEIELIDINLEQVLFIRPDDDMNTLVVKVKNEDNSIRIENYFTDDTNQLGLIRFASGQEIQKDVLENELTLMTQTTSDENPSVSGSQLLQMDLKLYGNTKEKASVLNGGSGNDYLDLQESTGEAFGGGGNDKIIAGEGNSKLYGGDGDDRFYIKKGVNFLDGGIGSNGYYFDRTFGDTVINNSAANQDELYYVSDYIVFEETKSKEVIIKKDIEDLIITSLYSDAKIKIENYYQTKPIKNIYFADQVAWNNKEIEETVEHYSKYDGEIIIDNNEVGTVSGSNKKDIIMSGQGDEVLSGANGVDLYKFSGDFGHDVIRDGGLNGEFNEIELIDINLDQVLFIRPDDDMNTLVLKVKNEENSIRIENYFTDDTNQLSLIRFASGQEIQKDVLENELTLMTQTTSDENPSVSGSQLLQMDLKLYGNTKEKASVLNGGSGNDYLDLQESTGEAFGGGGNDKIFAGQKDSKLYGGAGEDELIAGFGNDHLYGGAGDDKLIVGLRRNDAKIDSYSIGKSTLNGLTRKAIVKPDNPNDEENFGDNILDGGSGKNVYEFSREIGINIIKASSNEQNDYIYFTETKKNEVVLERSDMDLIISPMFNNGKIIVENYYQTKNLKEIRFLDGVLSEGEFNERIIEHNEFKGKIVFGDGKEGTLYGSSERDIIYSGRGDEILIGGEGVDTYRFSGNFGYDMIRDNGLSGQFNKIEFIDINLQHAHFYKSGDKNSLSIFIRGNNSLEIGTLYNCVTIENYFSDDSNMIESIEFASGEILDKVILKNEFSLLEQSTSDDNPSVSSSKLLNMNMELHGGTIEQVSILNGGTGYDVIIAGISGSEIYGGSGCDKIYSGSGNDNIQGGAGSDDIYFEGRFGHDILKKEDEIYNGFNNGDSIVFEANDSDFFVTYDDLYDKLSIKHIYTNDELLVEAFKSMYVNIGWVDFGYGSYSKDGLYKLSRTVTKKGDDMANTIKVNSGYGYSKINGNGGDDKLIGGRLHDVLMGGKGNDTLSAGSGYNELYGGEGNDILISENGYDHLYGGSGNDLYKMDGIDGIKEIYEDVWSNNVIEIEDKAPISIVLTKESEDLIITNDLYSSDGEITDKIILNDYYSNKDDVIESLTMGDKSISGQNIDLLIQAMSEYCSTNGVSWTNQLVESNTEVQNIITSYYTQV